MIIRDPHTRDFTQISNHLIQDRTIEPLDHWILDLLLSKRQNWSANKAQVTIETGLNKGTITKSFQRLETRGYLRKVSGGRGPDGRMIRELYDIIENPSFQPDAKDGDGKIGLEKDGFPNVCDRSTAEIAGQSPMSINGDGKTGTEKWQPRYGGGKTTDNNINGLNIKQQQQQTKSGDVAVNLLESEEQKKRNLLARHEIYGLMADNFCEFDFNYLQENISWAIQKGVPKNWKTDKATWIIDAIKHGKGTKKREATEAEEQEKMKKQKDSDDVENKRIKNEGDIFNVIHRNAIIEAVQKGRLDEHFLILDKTLDLDKERRIKAALEIIHRRGMTYEDVKRVT